MSLGRLITSWVNLRGLSIYWLAVACLLLAPWADAGMDWFAMRRIDLLQGEYWRFWTGPLVHSSWAHLGLSMAGLIVLQQMFGAELRFVNWAWCYGIVAPVIGVCWLAFPETAWLPFGGFDYVVGMSGLLHGLFAYAACLAMRRDRLLAIGTLLVIGAKVIWEVISGPSEFTADLIGMPVAATTHLYGFVGGLLLGITTKKII